MFDETQSVFFFFFFVKHKQCFSLGVFGSVEVIYLKNMGGALINIS